MKIISKDKLYVQKEDLLYLYENDKMMPVRLQASLKDALINNKDFVSITDEHSLEYIHNSSIYSFDELVRLNKHELEERYKYLTLDSLYSDEEEDLPLWEVIRHKKNQKYFLNQLKEIDRFRKDLSTLTYPDIPYPYLLTITNGEYDATRSYNKDSVIITGRNNEEIDYIDDYEFCKKAFASLTHDICNSLKDDVTIDYNGEYFIVKKKELVRDLKY